MINKDSHMDKCDTCDFNYTDYEFDDISKNINSLVSQYAKRLQAGIDDPDIEIALWSRPSPQIWSGLEYCCHIRDVFLIQRERLFTTLVESTPSFSPLYADQRAELGRYGAENIEQVGLEIKVSANLFSKILLEINDEQKSRTFIYDYPTTCERNITWLARHTLHEAYHHLRDLDLVTELSLKA